jgi:hypothetical protein
VNVGADIAETEKDRLSDVFNKLITTKPFKCILVCGEMDDGKTGGETRPTEEE